MSSVADVFNKPLPPKLKNKSSPLLVSDSYVGVECELSSATHVTSVPMWTSVQEGSLHIGGREFVLTCPMFGEDVITALDNLERAYMYSPPWLSYEASLHIHVDVRDLSTEQYCRFVMLYAVLEPLLFNTYCRDREQNPFCMQISEGGQIMQQVSNVLGYVVSDDAHLSVESRYGGINLRATRDFGSLEFRGHGPEYRKEPILRWINVLLCIKAASMSMEFPWSRPHLLFKDSDPDRILNNIFKEWAPEIFNNSDRCRLITVGCRSTRKMANLYVRTERLAPNTTRSPTQFSGSTDPVYEVDLYESGALRDFSWRETSRIAQELQAGMLIMNSDGTIRRVSEEMTTNGEE